MYDLLEFEYFGASSVSWSAEARRIIAAPVALVCRTLLFDLGGSLSGSSLR